MEHQIREYEREKEDQIRKLENTVKQLLAGKTVTVFVPVRRLWVYFNKSVKLTMLYMCGLILVRRVSYSYIYTASYYEYVSVGDLSFSSVTY